MALYTQQHDAPAIVAASREWIGRCLIQDGSVFSQEPLGSLENFNALDKYFVQRPDEGSGGFYDKLKAQLSPATSAAQKV